MSCLTCSHCYWHDALQTQRCDIHELYSLISLGYKPCKDHARAPGADSHEYPDTVESEIIEHTKDWNMDGVEIEIGELFNRGKLDER